MAGRYNTEVMVCAANATSGAHLAQVDPSSSRIDVVSVAMG